MRFATLRKEIAAVAFAKTGCKGPLPTTCVEGGLDKWCSWCKAKHGPPTHKGPRAKNPFADKIDFPDKISAGLSTDPRGACKGPSARAGMSCVETEYPREQWCSYCKAKNPPSVLN